MDLVYLEGRIHIQCFYVGLDPEPFFEGGLETDLVFWNFSALDSFLRVGP